LTLTYAETLVWMLGASINLTAVFVTLVGVLFAAIGAVLDRVRPNWFFGIRTPWTLSSERAWQATHRAGRWVFIGMGVLLVLAGLIQSTWALYAAFVVCGVAVLALIAYSFVVWRSDPDRTPAWPRPRLLC
jgi:immunity protein, SdpI family